MRHQVPAPAQAQSQHPTTASALLRVLGLSQVSAQHQRVELAKWLECNAASPELKLSLRINGYGLALPRPLRRSPVAPTVTMVPRAS